MAYFCKLIASYMPWTKKNHIHAMGTFLCCEFASGTKSSSSSLISLVFDSVLKCYLVFINFVRNCIIFLQAENEKLTLTLNRLRADAESTQKKLTGCRT